MDNSKLTNNSSLLNKVVLKPVGNSDLNKPPRFGAEKLYANESSDAHSLPLASDRGSVVEFSQTLEQLISSQVKHLSGGDLSNGTGASNENGGQQISPSRLASANSNLKALCDKVHTFRKLCLTYSEESLSPQQRFRLREILTKLEKNSDCLRSQTNQPVNDSQLGHLYGDLQGNIRDIITVVQK